MTQSKDTFPALLTPEQPGERMTLTVGPHLDPDRSSLSRNNFYHPVCVAERARSTAARERAALVEQMEGLAA